MAYREILLFTFLIIIVDGLGCYKEAPHPRPSVILTEPPHKLIKSTDLPPKYDWRSNTAVTPPTNQFLPYPCGSCWAHASTGALTDRFIIANGGMTIPHLSMQALIDCGYEYPEMGSCEGGSDVMAYKFIHDNWITDVTCSPYIGLVFTNWAETLSCPQRMCRQCDFHTGSCQFINGTRYYISEYGSVNGEDEMMAEIYKRGPIACSVYAHSESFLGYVGGIISDPVQYNKTTHVVAVIGWGVDDQTGMKYWIGRNSFGTEWGERGWFKLQRGTNTLNIENHPCAWAVPKI
jgi:cathepsin X